MTGDGNGPGQKPTSADVLLANQLYYAVEAQAYDQKNHVSNPAILRYYDRLLRQFVFEGRSADESRRWKACDVAPIRTRQTTRKPCSRR